MSQLSKDGLTVLPEHGLVTTRTLSHQKSSYFKDLKSLTKLRQQLKLVTSYLSDVVGIWMEMEWCEMQLDKRLFYLSEDRTRDLLNNYTVHSKSIQKTAQKLKTIWSSNSHFTDAFGYLLLGSICAMKTVFIRHRFKWIIIFCYIWVPAHKLWVFVL